MRFFRNRVTITDPGVAAKQSRLNINLAQRYVLGGLLSTGFAYGIYRGYASVRMPAPTFVGNLPSLSYDYAGNIDRIMLRGRGFPKSAEEVGATGDLVLAMATNRGRQF